MKTINKKYFQILFLLLTLLTIYNCEINAQLDTTRYFPLELGNYWEYWSIGSEVIPWFIWVTGDTLMDNGRRYFKLKNIYNYSDEGYNYYRLDSLNDLYQYVIRPDCNEKDELLYNFEAEDSSIWPICGNISQMGSYYYWIYQITTHFYPIFNSILSTKWFTSVLIDTTVSPPDTLWDPIYGGPIGVRKIAKGVGMVETIAELGRWFLLTGAIIDSNEYGTISGLEDIYEDFYKNKTQDADIIVYPNPFNNSTRLRYKISERSFVKIKVYDALGNEVATLVNEEKQAGEYEVEFNVSDLTSGIYFYRLQAGSFVETKKMILLK